MSLAFGREFLSIPGPGVIPDAVLQAMHRPAVDIYEGGALDTKRFVIETSIDAFLAHLDRLGR